MDFRDILLDLQCRNDPALLELRDEVRGFCQAKLPADIRSKVLLGQHLTREDHVRWHRLLAQAGLLVAHWPQEFGGRGWSRLQRWVFENELYRAGSPWLVPFGITYVAPVIYTYGNAAQKERWLGPIARAETWWAQGYSEPGAGSDLAAVRTTAVRDGDHYVVNGQKTWTTMAHWAEWMFALVRTDNSGAPQRGISFLLIDMASPGISVRPIGTIDGEHHVNEIFLEDVRVPVENRIGEEGGGWTYAKFLLGNERLLAAEVGRAQRLMAQLQEFLSASQPDGSRLSQDSGWQRRYADLETRILAVESLSYDLLAQAQAGSDPGALASVLKVLGSELIQSITSAQVDALGSGGLARCRPGGQPSAAGAIDGYLHDRAATIYGGSSEIQRNILAKAVLDL